MIKRRDYEDAQRRAAEQIKRNGITATDEEISKIACVDFGLNDLLKEGAQILTFLETERVAFKVLTLFPYQTEPEHWHPPLGGDPGKEETVRVANGKVYFYVPGENNMQHGFIPGNKESCYSVRHEIVMKPGDQITLKPGTKHWFQASEEGGVMYLISSCVRDILDQFTDPEIVRETKIID